MKLYSVLLGVVFLTQVGSGISQNLIQNGDFETYSNCPNSANQISLAIPWNTANTNVPSEYFNTCSSNPIVGIPINLDSLLGYQQTHSGNGYVGINSFAPLASQIKQYITAPLVDTLIAAQKYRLTFFVSLCNDSKYGIDGMGAYFSNQILNCPTFNCVLNQVPQVDNPSGNILLDTLNWMPISGSFTADGGECYITIGNFKDDTTTQKAISRPSNTWSTYYYIDDVSLIEDTSLDVNEIEIEKQILVYPNPAVSVVNIEVKGKDKLSKIEIYNLEGEIIFSKELNESDCKINAAEFRHGFYLMRCYLNSGKEVWRKLSIEK